MIGSRSFTRIVSADAEVGASALPVLAAASCTVPVRSLASVCFVALALLAAPGLSNQSARAQSSLSGGFERDVNRYRWTSIANISESAGAWDISFANRFLSDAFLLFDDRLSFRDENRFSWMAQRPLGATEANNSSSSPDVIFRGRADWFSLSRVFHQNAWAGVRFQPALGALLSPGRQGHGHPRRDTKHGGGQFSCA